MNDDAIQDLKQFIAATVHQEISGVKDDISTMKSDLSSVKQDIDEIKTDLNKLTHRVDDIDAKLDTVIEASGEQIDDHEKRITKLESNTA